MNNVYVSCRNHDWSIENYLQAIPGELVGEIHLAGHAVQSLDGVELLIDDHGSAVSSAVWELYRTCIERIGPVPTLIEWDSNIPKFEVLMHEAQSADYYLNSVREAHHAKAG